MYFIVYIWKVVLTNNISFYEKNCLYNPASPYCL